MNYALIMIIMITPRKVYRGPVQVWLRNRESDETLRDTQEPHIRSGCCHHHHHHHRHHHHHHHQHIQEPVWVDTVGWDDAEIGDDQTFREILTFIDK